MSDFYVPERAMAIFAHPDDIEFSCAGTLAKWVKEGTKVSYILITSGDSGIADPKIPKEKVIEIRELESRNAANIVGADEIIFLHEPDGLLEPSLELRKKLVREIRRFQPEVVICGDPTVILVSDSYINHPDHRAAATVAIDAVFPASGQPNLFEEIEKDEGFLAHKPRKVFISSWQNADTFINIDSTFDLKLKALRAHKSQMIGWDPEERMRDWTAEIGKGKEMKYAEGFKLITLVTDEDWKISNGNPYILDEQKHKKQKEMETKN
jgi:LmbE family N-acetylglucosaminyl deacetylase